jgi:hypothetical protein
MATVTTNYQFDVPTSSDLVKNGATQIALLGQDLDTFLFRPFTKNAMINGGCEIAQRGTAAVTLTAASLLYPVDRMFAGRNSGTTGATAQQISGTTLTGFNNAVRIKRTAGNTATNDLYIGQSMESLNSIPLAGQTVTFSFYARAGADFSSSGSALAVRLYSGTGTDQSGLGTGFTGTATPISTSQVITTSWVRYSFTAAVASTATQLQFLAFYAPVGTAGAADYVDITGIQLEVGSQVSPFTRSQETIQGELAACQRYYYRNKDSSTNYASFIPAAITANTTQSDAYLPLPVTMRTKPTSVDFANLETFDYVASAGYAISNVTINSNSSPNIAVASLTFATATAGRFIIVRGNNSSSAFLGFSAEL